MTTAWAQIESADDLRARIRELAVAEPNPAVITDQILRSLAADEFRAVATATLHNYVRLTILSGAATAEQPAPQTYETTSGGRTTSSKVAAIRDWVERELRRPICVDSSTSNWKFLADCTPDELLATAAMRRRKAAQTVAEAEHYEDIAKAVEHAGVGTVGDLPRDTLEAVLRR